MGINLALCSIMAEDMPLFLRQLVPKKMSSFTDLPALQNTVAIKQQIVQEY
jgi:hypothetical protein